MSLDPHTLALIAERASRGADLMDEEEPDWANKIVLSEFEISNCDKCILGQVFGSYTSGLVAVGEEFLDGEIHDFGFDLDCDYDETGIADDYFAELGKCWTKEITTRVSHGQ